MILGTLGASLLGILSSDKNVHRPGYGLCWPWSNRTKILMAFRPLKNYEIQKYYQKEPRFKGVYSINNYGAHVINVINLDFYTKVETHWAACYLDSDISIYFHSFGIEHVVTPRLGNLFR